MKPLVRPQATLKLLDASTEVQSRLHETTVVAISDLGQPDSIRAWTDGNDCWLRSILPSLVKSPQVWEYQYVAASGSEFSWETLWKNGETLLEQLLTEAIKLPELFKRPLIFICHGAGGLVLKQALGTLYEQYQRESFDRLTRVLSGIIFLGCPHPTYDRPQDWSKLALLIRATTKLSKREADAAAAKVSVTARISQHFSSSGTLVPILSIVEQNATKIRSSFLLPKREVLVDRLFGRTCASRETVVELELDHSEICHVNHTGPLAYALKNFFATIEISATLPESIIQGKDDRSVAEWTQTDPDEDHFGFFLRQMANENSGPVMATVGTRSGSSGFEIVPLREPITNAIKEINLPLYVTSPHSRNPNFYGREDVLQILRDALIPPPSETGNTSGPRTFALCGMGGLGKTQLAVEFALSYRESFDAVFLITASDTGRLSQAYVDICTDLGLELGENRGTVDQIVCKSHVLHWLSNPVWKMKERTKPADGTEPPPPKWFLVFDNADDLSILRDFWPISENGSILVTSRDPLAKGRTHIPVSGGIDLLPFSPTDSGQLLRSLTGFQKAGDILISEKIGKELSGLPLALVQIASTIRRRNLDFGEFLDLYQNADVRSNIYRSEDTALPNSLNALWSFEDSTPESLCLMHMIAFLNPDGIPESLLLRINDLEESEKPSNFPSTAETYTLARTELTKASLIIRQLPEKLLTTHRITQDVIRARMTIAELQTTFSEAVYLLYRAWPFSEFEFSTARAGECEPLLPHVTTLYRIFLDHPSLRDAKDIVAKLARLIMDFGWTYVELGNLPQAVPYLHTSLEICDLDTESTHITRGDALGCLAQCANHQDDPDSAIKYAQESINIFVVHEPLPRVGTREGWRLAQAYNELGEAYMSALRWEEALEQEILAIDRYSSLPYEDYPDWAMMNKGWCLFRLNRYDEAAQPIETFLQYQENTYGKMDTTSMKYYMAGQGCLWLGAIRAKQGHISEALDLYLQALAQYCSTISEKHFRVAALYNTIGSVYMELQQFEEACIMFEKALLIYYDKPAYAADIARTCFRLAATQSRIGLLEAQAGRYEQSGKYMVQAAESTRRGEMFKAVLEKKYSRSIQPSDLEQYIPWWTV